MSNISIKGLPSLDGNLLKPLFEYLLKACPKADEGDDGGDALSHVMFTTDLSVVACDGARWHAVHLPAVEGLLFPEPYAVTRQSLEDFVKLLRAGCSIVGKANRLAVFIDHYPEGEPGLRFIIEREGELWPFTMSRAHFLGPTPRRWVPPVAADAPLLTAEPPRLNGKHLSEATCLDETVARWRQAEEGGPVRIDLATTVRDVESQMVIATAVLLPLGVRARLLDQKQKELFARENPGAEPGTSILSLVIDGPKGVERPGEVIFDATRPRRVRDDDDDGMPPGMAEMLDPGPTAAREVKPKPRNPTAGGRELRDQLGAPSTKRAPAAAPAPKSAKRGGGKAGPKGKGKRS